MRWLLFIGREILGLFVDDGSFALAILLWLGAAWLVLPHLGIAPVWRGALLAGGLVCLLAENLLRAARRS